MNRNKKAESFAGIRKSGRFARTSLNDMRRAGREAHRALMNANINRHQSAKSAGRSDED